MTKRKVANPLALSVLALLYERPMHPYEMAATMRERGKHESIKLNYGSLYTVVDALQRHGLIVPRETVREGRRPERTVYALTDAGRVELFDWLRDLIRRPVKEYPQFMAGLSLLGVLPPDEAIAALEERARGLEASIHAVRSSMETAQVQRVPRIFLIESEYEVQLKETELRFVRDLVRAIQENTLEGVDLWRAFHATHAPAAEEVRGGE